MKKIITLIVALFMVCGFATAQTVEHGKLFQNLYMGIDGGIVTPMIPAEGETYFSEFAPTFGLELGKNINQVIGLSIEGQGFTTKQFDAITNTNVVGKMKINLSNWLAGYKGYPRRVEFVLAPGLGWMHDFAEGVEDPNYLTYNTGMEVNFNLGQNRAWQVNLKPSVIWNKYNGTGMGFYGKDADMRLTAGVTYKFGYRNNEGVRTHNLTVCPYTVTSDEYNSLMDKYNECMNREPETKEAVVEKVVEKVVYKAVEKPSNTFIDFEIGSSEISPTAKRTIEFFAKQTESFDNLKVKVIGSADSKTGTKELNDKLAWARANAVASELVKQGVKEVATEMVIDIDENAEASRCAVIVTE